MFIIKISISKTQGRASWWSKGNVLDWSIEFVSNHTVCQKKMTMYKKHFG